jgi:hypothetical protein
VKRHDVQLPRDETPSNLMSLPVNMTGLVDGHDENDEQILTDLLTSLRIPAAYHHLEAETG